jgi:hypothetical protein
MEGRFGPGSAIAHKAAGFRSRPGKTIGIRAVRQQNFENAIMAGPFGGA